MVAHALTYWPNVGPFGPSLPQPPNLTSLRKLQYTSARTNEFSSHYFLFFYCNASILFQVQQSLLYQVQQGLLYQVQQSLPNWPTNYKFAFRVLS